MCRHKRLGKLREFALFQQPFPDNTVGFVLLQIRPDLCIHILDGFIAEGVFQILLHELVIDLRIDCFGNIIDRRYKYGVFSLQICILGIFVRECNIDIDRLAGFMSDELLQEIINIGSHADRNIRTVSAGASAFKLDAVDAADIIDVDGITVLDFTILHLLGRGKRSSDGFDLRLYLFLCYIHIRLLENGILIIRKRNAVHCALVRKIAFFIKAH